MLSKAKPSAPLAKNLFSTNPLTMDTLSKGSKYQAVAEADYHDELDIEFSQKGTYLASRSGKTIRMVRSYNCYTQLALGIANVVFLFASLALLLFSHQYLQSMERNANNRLVKMTSTYSKNSFVL